METKNESTVALIKQEINKQLADPETMKSLLETTFKGLEAATMKRALLEGMIRGFSFKDFLEKNVYAIPYGTTYSLVTSVDHSRKIGMRSGVIGVTEPVYEMGIDGKTIIACSVTVKRRVGADIGEFTAKVYFGEYSTGKNLWSSKPRTMIAKVAEMHAYRKACPEELAQSYVEEEIQREMVKDAPVIDLDRHRAELEACKTNEALERVWADMPASAKPVLKGDMEYVKAVIKQAAQDEAAAEITPEKV